jgi:hypothetical protein
MKSLSQNLIIVSSSIQNVTAEENRQRHVELTNQLNLLTVPFESLTGRYGGLDEHCVMIDGSHTQVAEMIMREYDQESYLVHHNDRTCELVFSNGHRKKIGVMREVSEEEALKRNAWTKNKGKYYVAD